MYTLPEFIFRCFHGKFVYFIFRFDGGVYNESYDEKHSIRTLSVSFIVSDFYYWCIYIFINSTQGGNVYYIFVKICM